MSILFEPVTVPWAHQLRAFLIEISDAAGLAMLDERYEIREKIREEIANDEGESWS